MIQIEKNTFGERLYNKITEVYGSKYAFCNATGISRHTIDSYCKNMRHPNTLILAELCKKLDVSADWLIFGKKAETH